jgi:YesN/AraC family two-component response regulator
MRFLIVDDTSRARHSMKALLEVWNLAEEVCEAENGMEALRLAEEFQPDVILMDVRLPLISGLEATRQIKTKWPQIKIIVMSVFFDYQKLAKEAGADGFVSKGDLPDDLRKLIVEFSGKMATMILDQPY